VIWFGGWVTALTFVSFVLMASCIESVLLFENLTVEKVISSVIAAWADVASGLSGSLPAVSTGVSLNDLQNLAGAVRGLNVGYFWMLVNCLTSAAYVRLACFWRVIDANTFTLGAFHAEKDQIYRIFRLGLYVLQQPAQYPSPRRFLTYC
jgi:hypothetical protein